MLNTQEDFDRFAEEVKPEIDAALERIDPGVCYQCDMEHTWDMLFAEDRDEERRVCVTFTLFDGDVSAGEPEGFNAGWTACEPGGLLLGNCIPHNYTDRVCNRDEDELRHRIESTIEALAEWVESEGWEDR